jgi:hypothetical protein
MTNFWKYCYFNGFCKGRKNFVLTPRYATQCEIQVKNFLVDSALCRIAGSRDSALCGIAQSCDSALCGIARSRFSSLNSIKYLSKFESICKTVLAHESGDPGVQFNEKNRGSKISWHCPFKYLQYPTFCMILSAF